MKKPLQRAVIVVGGSLSFVAEKRFGGLEKSPTIPYLMLKQKSGISVSLSQSRC